MDQLRPATEKESQKVLYSIDANIQTVTPTKPPPEPKSKILTDKLTLQVLKDQLLRAKKASEVLLNKQGQLESKKVENLYYR